MITPILYLLGGVMVKISRYIRAIRRVSVIKSIHYSLKYKAKILIGRGTILNIAKGANIIIKEGPLRIGMDYSIPQKTIFEMREGSSFIAGGYTAIMKGCKIYIDENAVLSIGNHSFINENSRIQCSKKVLIGNNCAISWNVQIIDTDIHKMITDGKPSISSGEISIGNNVWVGCSSVILKRISIGDGSVIGAGSVVTKNIPAGSLSAGNPCKTVKQEILWEA